MNRRDFIKLGTLGTLITGTGLGSCSFSNLGSDDTLTTDIAVVGGTPAGIMAAISAARLGARVVLLEYHNHLGGMSTSGLGKSDIENKDAIAGLFKEFTERVLQYYVAQYGENSENVKLCRAGYYYEPSVAERVFNQMIAEEENIQVMLNCQAEHAVVSSNTVKKAVFLNRNNKEEVHVQARVFIDATYEGDLYALAGAAYQLGREGNDEYQEAHAGRIFFDYNEKVILEGSTGESDKKLPAYTYRLCMTDDPDNSFVMTEPPAGYDRNRYVRYFEDLDEGRLSAPKNYRDGHGYYKDHFDTMVRVFSFTELPNRKYDVNINPRPLGFPFAGENYDYPEANWTERERIFKHHRELTLGLIYFTQNDPEIPDAHRQMARQYHLPLDEFTDNEHFPWQFYIREARRLEGQYTLTENDVTLQSGQGRTTVFEDTIITGEFPIDSFPVSKEASKDRKVLEGYIGLLDISPYQVPYRILIPKKINGLIVPVAVSTTHVAYSTVRMEPLWMGIGQVAGIAAQMALNDQINVRDVPVHALQQQLIESRQILTYFEDLEPTDNAFSAVQFWGTKGFFTTYRAATGEALTGTQFRDWINLAKPWLKESIPEMVFEDNISIAAFKNSLPPDRFHLSDAEWLYAHRPATTPVLRGEVCIALYSLFLQRTKG